MSRSPPTRIHKNEGRPVVTTRQVRNPVESLYPFIVGVSGCDGGGRLRDAPEDVPVESPLDLGLLGCLSPRRGRQLQDAARGPARQKAEQVAQVGPRFDAMQLAAGEDRCERGVDLAGIVVADEDPNPFGETRRDGAGGDLYGCWRWLERSGTSGSSESSDGVTAG
jgi:hypothetical protein